MKHSGIEGKRALVTGGARGIGLAIAKSLLELKATVYIADCNKEALNKAVMESGNKLIPLEIDVSKWDDTRNVVKNILPIHLLVNNAATLFVETVLEAAEEHYLKTMNTNLKSGINLTQFIARDLIHRNLPGSVVNISSQCSTRVIKDYLFYNCSKAAIDIATKCFALELGPKNIRVNAVNPTLTRTENARWVWDYPERLDPFLERVPLAKIAETKDIANAVNFLLSDDSAMITGHCLYVDGGFTTT